ncbi:MAG: ChaB family protein [Vulcanimicrobiota bacterium]
MPYSSKSKLPQRVKGNLPPHAQDIFKEAFNNAWEHYSDPDDRKRGSSREEAANRVAWSAVKSRYKKNEQGEWVKK